MDRPFFVMLNNQARTKLVPLVDDEGQLAMFEFYLQASVAGSRNPLGNANGFEIFCAGEGE